MLRERFDRCVMELIYLDGVGLVILLFVFFQAEDGIRDLVRSRGLGDVYKRQALAILYIWIQ